MRIGEFAALAGVSTRTVRHYHDVGVLPEPERHSNGYREYGIADVTRLLRIRHLVSIGLPLQTAARLLEPQSTEVTDELQALEHSLRMQIHALKEQLDAVQAARRSALPEAPGEYGDLDDLTRTVLADGRVRRIEADLSLILFALDPNMHRDLGARVTDLAADPELARSLARVATELFAADAATTDSDKDRIAAELGEVISRAGLPQDFGFDVDELVSQYRAEAFSAEQLDILGRIPFPEPSGHDTDDSQSEEDALRA